MSARVARPAATASLLAALLGALACGGAGDGGGPAGPAVPTPPAPPPPPAPVSAVRVSPDTGTVIVDSTLALSVALTDAAAQALSGRAVTWSSSDSALVRVSPAGVVTAAGYGDATITATSEGKSGAARVRARMRFSRLAVGAGATCALGAGGAAWCWGDNTSGQLGTGAQGASTSASTPVRVTGGRRYGAVSAGRDHACALAADSTAWCWGANTYGQIGDGTTSGRTAPVAVAGGLRFAAITAGNYHTCALRADGAAYCWGDNSARQVAPAQGATRYTNPQPVGAPAGLATPLRFRTIVAGGLNTCATLADGTGAWCWGNQAVLAPNAPPAFARISAAQVRAIPYGHIGVPSGTTTITEPTRVDTFLTFSTLAAGGLQTCGLASSGRAYCWGQNAGGQLGDGTTTARATPTLVVGQP